MSFDDIVIRKYFSESTTFAFNGIPRICQYSSFFHSQAGIELEEASSLERSVCQCLQKGINYTLSQDILASHFALLLDIFKYLWDQTMFI